MSRKGGASPRRPALVDVGRAAGVSAQTVSRVLNNHPQVSTATRNKVEAAVQMLGYRRNLSAHALATGVSTLVGVVVGESDAYGPHAVVRALLEAAQRGALTVILERVQFSDPQSAMSAAERLLDYGVLGLVVVEAPEAALHATSVVVPHDIPIVSVGDAVAADVLRVPTHQYLGARAATEHLLSLGHKGVHHVAGPLGSMDADERERGWMDALGLAGLDAPPVLRGDWSAASGFEAGRLLARMPTCTAVFCANDQMAFGLAKALTDAGRDIPGHVSLIGFDDTPEAAFFATPLTTMRQDVRTTAATAVSLILRAAHDSRIAPESPLEMPPSLVVRDSTRRMSLGSDLAQEAS